VVERNGRNEQSEIAYVEARLPQLGSQESLICLELHGARVHRVNVHGHDRAADNRFYEQSGSAYVERERVVADPQQRCE